MLLLKKKIACCCQEEQGEKQIHGKYQRKSKGVAYGFGQSNVWYAQGREQHNLLGQFLN